MLEWAVDETGDVDDPRVVKQANPASWLTVDALRDQRAALPDAAFRRYHCGQWNASSDSPVFPPGAWAACAGDAIIPDGTEIIVAIDAGKGASESAVVWCDVLLRVGVTIIEGTGTAHEIDATVDDLARRYRIREVIADPWHVVGYLSERWEQRGLQVVEYPQFDSRLVPATDRLHRAVTERWLQHPDDPQLNAHVHGSLLRDTRRGVRVDKQPGATTTGSSRSSWPSIAPSRNRSPCGSSATSEPHSVVQRRAAARSVVQLRALVYGSVRDPRKDP